MSASTAKHRHYRLVFAPGKTPTNAAERRRWAAVYRALNEFAPTLFLAEHRTQLYLGARPGPGTLFSPRMPDVTHRALASATAVLSPDPELIARARSLGTPAILLTSVEPDWDALADCASAPRQPVGQAPVKNGNVTPPLLLAAACDWSFLPALLGFIENLRFVHGENFHLHLLTLDAKVKRFLERHEPSVPLTLHALPELVRGKALAILRSRPMALRAVCGKIPLLRKVLALHRRPALSVDLDLCFFRSPVRLLEGLRGTLLFPHWSDSPAHRQLCGLYNGGMMGVGPGAERFLDWLMELSLYKCELAPGFFYEQGYLDLAPLYFDNVTLYRGRDENIAPWNLRMLDVQVPDGAPLSAARAGKSLVGSYHAHCPDLLGLYDAKISWDLLGSFFSPLGAEKPSAALYRAALYQQRYHWPEMHRFLFGSETLKSRLHLPRVPPSPPLTRLFVQGPPRHLLGAAARPYALCRRGKRWLDAQRRRLFGPDLESAWRDRHREVLP